MTVATIYPSKPLDCWPRLMEMRRKFARDMWSAKERGELQIIGGTGPLNALPVGLGEFHYFGGLGPNFGRIMEDKALLVRCIETAEQAGFGSDTCSTLRATLGSMFLGVFDLSRSGERIKADFALDMQVCQAQGKTNQLWGEHYGVPCFTIEVPPFPRQIDYLVDQMREAIEWMEKVTGRTYQDERLIAGVKNEWQCRVLWARLCMLQKAIPAPLDQVMLFSLNTVTWRGGRHRKEVVDLYQEVLAETEDRVKQGIAARPYESCRLMHEGAATWYKSGVLRYPRKYGATFMGSHQVFTANGAYITREDNSLEVGPTLQELGRELNTREEALRALAELYLRYAPGVVGILCLDSRVNLRVKVYQDWHADAVVFNLDRGCRGTTVGNTETGLLCQKLGIPYMYYEGNVTNPRELNEVEYMARMDSLMESLGLRPMEEKLPEEPEIEAGGTGH